MNKILSGWVWLIAGAIFVWPFSQGFAEPLRVTLVLSDNAGAYQEFSSVLSSKLSGLNNIELTVTYLDKPLPASDLVVTAGMGATRAALQTANAPLLAVLVPKEGMGRLLKESNLSFKSGDKGVSAIYLDQPLKRQVGLIASLMPHAHAVGVLYTSPPKEIAMLRTLLAARKQELVERTVTSVSIMHVPLQELLLSSDVLLALPDAEIYNASTIRNILLATYRNRVPLIGFSAGYVNAGALAAVYSRPDQIAGQTASLIQEFASGVALPAPQYAREFEVSINDQVARSLGLTVKSASQVRAEIGNTP